MKKAIAWIFAAVIVAGAGAFAARPDWRARWFAHAESPAGVAHAEHQGSTHDPDNKPATHSTKDEHGEKDEGKDPHAEKGERAEKDEHAEKGEKKEPEEHARISRGPNGDIIVAFDVETQKRVGIKTMPLAARINRLETEAYGLLQEDSAQSFTLRAPGPGVLHEPHEGHWPDIGQTLSDDAVVGAIAPRLTPAEQIDMAARLATSRGDESSAAAAVDAARASYESKKSLYAQGKVIAERQVQEAEAKLKNEEARLRTANQTVKLIESAIDAHIGATGTKPLAVARGGEVVEVLARPGESVESGQSILRVVRFASLIARIEVPVGQQVDAGASKARVVPVGREDAPSLAAERIGTAANADATRQGLVLLYRVALVAPANSRSGDVPLRPGVAIVAYLPVSGAAQTGVVIPRAALVRSEGRAWAYVQTDEQKFTRREVATDSPADAGWFTATRFAPGDRVVVEGAESLLSEELKPQIEKEVQAAG